VLLYNGVRLGERVPGTKTNRPGLPASATARSGVSSDSSSVGTVSAETGGTGRQPEADRRG
jgi:hypothetical protein